MPSLLLVTATFAPSRLIGGRRAERLAACLVQAGWRVTVLTTPPFYAPPIDWKLEVPPGVEVVRAHAIMPRTWLRAWAERARQLRPVAPSGPSTAAVSAGQRSTFSTPARQVLDWTLAPLEFPDEHAGWRPFAEAAVRGRRFDVVLGSLPPFTDALIARTLARRMDARLVLDFRDPWTEVTYLTPGVDAATCARHRRMENELLDAADLIVGVSPTHCTWLEARTRTEVILARNGYDPEHEVAQATPPTSRPLHLVYAGSMAYGRDLRCLFQALAAVRPALGTDALQLTYAGESSALVRNWAAEAGVADLTEDLGQIGVAQARELVDRAGLCVVRVSDTYFHQIPAKIYDIAARRRPILLIGPEGCDAARLVREFGLGWACAPDDVPAIAAVLHEAAQGKGPVLDRAQGLRIDASLAPLLERLQQMGQAVA